MRGTRQRTALRTLWRGTTQPGAGWSDDSRDAVAESVREWDLAVTRARSRAVEHPTRRGMRARINPAAMHAAHLALTCARRGGRLRPTLLILSKMSRDETDMDESRSDGTHTLLCTRAIYTTWSHGCAMFARWPFDGVDAP